MFVFVCARRSVAEAGRRQFTLTEQLLDLVHLHVGRRLLLHLGLPIIRRRRALLLGRGLLDVSALGLLGLGALLCLRTPEVGRQLER